MENYINDNLDFLQVTKNIKFTVVTLDSSHQTMQSLNQSEVTDCHTSKKLQIAPNTLKSIKYTQHIAVLKADTSH